METQPPGKEQLQTKKKTLLERWAREEPLSGSCVLLQMMRKKIDENDDDDDGQDAEGQSG